jgi:arabinogalactan oligomer/maltooligosaccharide transport system substrate-binding protein
MKNKLFLGLAVLGTVATLASCGGNKAPDYTIWVSEKPAIVELTKQQIDAFKAEKGYDFTYAINGVSEADAAGQMLTDVESGADMFAFAQDQLTRLVTGGALMQLSESGAAEVSASHDAGAVKAATVNGKIYAYPLTSDNGYFMYYDKSVVKESSVDSLEAIIADVKAAGKKFAFELENSWYTASFFFATGCVNEWTTDADGEFVSVNDTFNSAEGLVAAKGMAKLVRDEVYLNSSAAKTFGDAIPSAVVVSGVWDYTVAAEKLGDNFGVADLPSFEVDGQSYHLGSFSGNKLIGIKPQTDINRAKLLNELGSYLTSEAAQLARFEAEGWGPSNKAAQASDAVKADPTLCALAAQNAYATPQGNIHGSWWDIAKVITTTIKGTTDDASLQAALDTYKNAIDALFEMSDEEKNAFTVIGSFNNTGWGTDFAMEQVETDVWVSVDTFAVTAADEFKVRQGKAWTVAFGGPFDAAAGLSNQANFKCTDVTPGNYKVKLTVTRDGGNIVSGVVELIAA